MNKLTKGIADEIVKNLKFPSSKLLSPPSWSWDDEPTSDFYNIEILEQIRIDSGGKHVWILILEGSLVIRDYPSIPGMTDYVFHSPHFVKQIDLANPELIEEAISTISNYMLYGI